MNTSSPSSVRVFDRKGFWFCITWNVRCPRTSSLGIWRIRTMFSKGNIAVTRADFSWARGATTSSTSTRYQQLLVNGALVFWQGTIFSRFNWHRRLLIHNIVPKREQRFRLALKQISMTIDAPCDLSSQLGIKSRQLFRIELIRFSALRSLIGTLVLVMAYSVSQLTVVTFNDVTICFDFDQGLLHVAMYNILLGVVLCLHWLVDAVHDAREAPQSDHNQYAYQTRREKQCAKNVSNVRTHIQWPFSQTRPPSQFGGRWAECTAYVTFSQSRRNLLIANQERGINAQSQIIIVASSKHVQVPTRTPCLEDYV